MYMELWIARDPDGELVLYKTEPKVREYLGQKSFDTDEEFLPIDNSLYPEVTFENSPRKIKINLI